MARIVRCCTFVTVVILLGVTVFAPREIKSQDIAEANLATAKRKWEEWFATNIKPNDMLADIHSKLKESCRDRSLRTTGGSGTRDVYYNIDDFHDIWLVINREDKLIRQPVIIKRSKWIKLPDGQLLNTIDR